MFFIHQNKDRPESAILFIKNNAAVFSVVLQSLLNLYFKDLSNYISKLHPPFTFFFFIGRKNRHFYSTFIHVSDTNPLTNFLLIELFTYSKDSISFRLIRQVNL